MAGVPIYQPITVDQFLKFRFPEDNRYELVNGMIRAMTGGSPAHARVATNIVAFLRFKLRGTGCHAYGSDLGIKLDHTNVRYPDVSVYRGEHTTREAEQAPLFTDPVVVFEVLSPSTSQIDQNEKLAEYRAVGSLHAIILVDPINEHVRVVQRSGPIAWRDDLHAQPHYVALPVLGVTIPHAEIFARD